MKLLNRMTQAGLTQARMKPARLKLARYLASASALLLLGLFFWSESSAQVTAPRILTVPSGSIATLEDQLVYRLRATRDDQRAYIHYVVQRVNENELERSLVIAIERYSLRRNRGYPFPFFERALRYEAAKRGVELPSIRHFATTRVVSE